VKDHISRLTETILRYLQNPARISNYVYTNVLGRIAAIAIDETHAALQTEWRGLSVRLSVTTVSPAKAAEPIVMPFGMLTRVGPRNYVLDGVQIPDAKGQF